MKALRTLKMYPEANVREQEARNSWGGRQRGDDRGRLLAGNQNR